MQIQPPWFRLLLTIACAYLCMADPFPAQADQATSKVLAMVNDVAITHQDLTIEMAQLQAEMRHRHRPLSARQMSRLRNQLIDNLINRELLYQRAQQMQIKIRDSWIDRALIELKAQFGKASNFETFLTDTGLTQEQFQAHMAKSLIVRRLLRREVIPQSRVSEAEMQAFFRQHPEFFKRKEQIRARHILVAFEKGGQSVARGEALLRIQSIQMMLAEGADFASLAIEHSDDPSKSRGGDLGYLERDQMVESFANAAFKLKKGEVSDIVETEFGFHLIQMVDRTPSSPMAYRNTRTKIERTLRRNKEMDAANAYLAQLKRQSSIRR
jgi:peptidyl-prolyl cis-trans isomerase C